MEAMELYSLIPYGKKNAITRAELMTKTGMQDRQIRDIISYIRINSHAICSTSKGAGYYRPANRQELQEFIDETENRAKSTFAILKTAKAELRRDYHQLEFGF